MPDDIVAQAGLQFSRLAHDPALIRSAWICSGPGSMTRSALRSTIRSGARRLRKAELLLDSFYQLIPFGTGGRAGAWLWAEPHQRSDRRALVQGTATISATGSLPAPHPRGCCLRTRIFAISAAPTPSPRPSADRRHSQALARIACEIYAANGFEVHVAGDDYNSGYLSTRSYRS